MKESWLEAMLDSSKILNALSVGLYHKSKNDNFFKPCRNCDCVRADEVHNCPKLLIMTRSIYFDFFKFVYFQKQHKK